MGSLKRDFLPPDLAPLARAAGIDGTVAVQARQIVQESYWLLELAGQYPLIKGVVGWVDLRSPAVGEALEELSHHQKFRGVRHVVHDEPDDDFMMREDFRRGIGQLRRYGLTYDLLLFPRHLPLAYELVRLFPEQPFIIDHISKPLIKDHKLESWKRNIRDIAKCANVFCKVSGMVTEADWHHWKPPDFTPYLDVVFESFGTKRITIGSDWPVCTLAASYGEVMKTAGDYVRRLSKYEQADVWGENAKRLYGIAA